MHELPPGTQLGRFTIVGPLGKGGMGTVHRARDASGSEVALKLLSPLLANDLRYVERFRREAELAAKVRHPNVVSCLGSGSDRGVAWIAFELVPGGTLKERIRASERLPWREAARLGAEVARGLAAIHAVGLVHRDLKPANVLLDASGRAKVSDLGLARGFANTRSLTTTGELVGTFEYVAPEQTESAKVDHRADLYSLGCLLHEAVAGRPPFQGQGLALIAQHVSAVAPPLRELVPETPPALGALVKRLLAKRPEERGASALAVAGELDAIADAGPRSARGRLVAAALGAAGALLVAGALVAIGVARSSDRGGSAAPPPPAPSPPRSLPAPRSRPSWFEELEVRPQLEGTGIAPVATSHGDYVNGKDGSILRYVAGGTFTMGCPREGRDVADNGASRPEHEVEVAGFFIGKFEVSIAQFARFVAETGYRTGADEEGNAILKSNYDGFVLREGDEVGATAALPFEGVKRAGVTWRCPYVPGEPAPRDRPVTLVRWGDARAYARWAGLELPSEAQWELAAAGKERRRHPWGPDDPTREAPLANVGDGALRRAVQGMWTLPVDAPTADVSPCEARHMAGNVREWCDDVFDGDFYKTSEACARDPLATKPPPAQAWGKRHATRGGSWVDGPNYAVTYNRHQEERAVDVVGFRVVYSLDRDLAARKLSHE